MDSGCLLIFPSLLLTNTTAGLLYKEIQMSSWNGDVHLLCEDFVEGTLPARVCCFPQILIYWSFISVDDSYDA